MKSKAATLLLWLVLLSCVHQQDDWRQHEDKSIRMPTFDASTKADLTLDGVTLQAIRIAADDFLPPSASARSCAEAQAAYDYEVRREGNVIFVRIAENPERCGEKYHALDGAVRYAISTDGRILRRVLDGEPEGPEPDDAGLPHQSFELPTRPDGGTPVLDMSVHWDASLMPPGLRDGGGLGPGPDAGPTQLP